jgi:hypothetical protein
MNSRETFSAAGACNFLTEMNVSTNTPRLPMVTATATVAFQNPSQSQVDDSSEKSPIAGQRLLLLLTRKRKFGICITSAAGVVCPALCLEETLRLLCVKMPRRTGILKPRWLFKLLLSGYTRCIWRVNVRMYAWAHGRVRHALRRVFDKMQPRDAKGHRCRCGEGISSILMRFSSQTSGDFSSVCGESK